MATIDRLLTELNEKRGLKYPDVGFLYYADIKGDGQSPKSVWRIMNDQGGVCYSELNARTPKAICDLIRGMIRITDEKRV